MKDVAGMKKNRQKYKSEAYELLGKFYNRVSEFEKGLKCFKKQMQIAWI
jgi:hypothetical protein